MIFEGTSINGIYEDRMDDDLKDAMQSLRKSRSVLAGPHEPPTKPPAKAQAPKARTKAKIKAKGNPKPPAKGTKPKATPASSDQVLTPEIVGEEGIKGISLKDQLTMKEVKFIELHLTGSMTIEKAMIAAGYEEYSQNHRYFLAKKIIEKYESLADDHRKIMRAMGYGESKIIELLIDSAEKASSEMVKLQARIALARCLGLQKEVVEVQHGMNIIIKSRSQAPPATPIEGGARPALVHQIEHKPGPKSISITK